MGLTIDVVWSFRSRYSYLATPRLVRLAAEYDVDIGIRVVLPIAVRILGFFDTGYPLWPPYLLRDTMRIGDGVFFYHSSCPEPGIAGLAEVASAAYPDASQFDKKSPYYDPGAKKAEPRWVNVDVRALKKTKLVPLAELRRHKALAKMRLLRPGNRLSITPVSAAEWKYITERLI